MISTMQAQGSVGTRMRGNAPTPRFVHLARMLTEIGIWQHAEGDQPNIRHGYSIDDEARGLIVGLQYWQQGIEAQFHETLATTCFRFLEAAAVTDGPDLGRFHNFCDAQGRWLDSVGSDDSFGRTLWGLGIAAAVDAPFAPQSQATALLERSLPAARTLNPIYLRAQAFAIFGLAASRIDDGLLRQLADTLADAFEATAGPGWRWFEPQMTYGNARLPQALFAASALFPDEARNVRIATEALDFLLQVTHDGKSSYAPVGNAPMERDGWFKRGQRRPPLFDQQPVDAGALVECCVAAYHATAEPRFRKAAYEAFGWYLGDNLHSLPVYHADTGGVADALTRSGISRNQGAESVLSFHLALHALETLE